MTEAQASKVNEMVKNFIAQKEQRDYEENLHCRYDAFLEAGNLDEALYHAALIEEFVIPKYGKNSCEYTTVLFKKGMVFKRANKHHEDRIEALWLLIESKRLYLKYSECWKSCMREISEMIGT